ncbi:hypothetical protein BAE44_0020924, partial [Dichanthelium oligosanthes]
LDSFCSAYSCQLVDRNSRLFAELALRSLNREIKNEEDKFKLSDHVSLCHFDEGDASKLKKYAHMNFYAHTASGKVLVFAELQTEAWDDADSDDWTVSSCQVLPKNYHGITLFHELLFIKVY